MIWVYFVILTLLSWVYLYYNSPFKQWTKKGVKQADTKTILISFYEMVLRKRPLSECVQMGYNLFPDSRYTGTYDMFTPSLVPRDPELIKEITVKDFEHFVNHSTFLPADSDPLWEKNLFALHDQKWKDMRSTLSPAFTSSKIKNMFGLMCKNAQQFSQFFIDKDEDLISIEMKDAIARFTNDIIASTAFGIECDSLKNRDNEFYRMGRRINNFSFLDNFKFFLFAVVPHIGKIITIKFFPEEVSNFFNGIISDNIATREKNKIVRHDMINLLMDARKNGLRYEEDSKDQNEGFATVEESDIGKSKKGQKVSLTDQDITAQALIFFLAGFETVSTAMCFMTYELGINPDIQEKLTQEIDDTYKNCNGQLTYESLQKMKYLDMVVSETLRKWPVNTAVDRVCTKQYTIKPTNPDEKPVIVEKNTPVYIPTSGLHRDPKYFPDPEKFDPGRFSEENKSNIRPYTYLPFGAGPRNCIGSRFALLEIKAFFFYLLRDFQIVPTEKTENPIKLSKRTFTMDAENGFWLGLKGRNKIIVR